MNQIVKAAALNLFSELGVHLTKRTDPVELEELISKLKPVTCGRELIRMGPKGDGGYLVPDDLDGISACFSPGVDRISGFEMDCAESGMSVFLADKSVESPPETHKLFHFTKKYVGVTTNEEFMTLDDWVASSMPDSRKDLLLQIDIEGFEYEVFLGASDQLMKRFRIIVIEFHDLDQLWNKPFFKLASRVFEKLLQTHRCVHNHPNNCCPAVRRGNVEIPPITEITFLRMDRIVNPAPAVSFPHPLDFDNTPRPSLVLPKCWYE